MSQEPFPHYSSLFALRPVGGGALRAPVRPSAATRPVEEVERGLEPGHCRRDHVLRRRRRCRGLCPADLGHGGRLRLLACGGIRAAVPRGLLHGGLEGVRGEPLLGEAALEEGHAGGEVGEAVDPAGDVAAGEDLGEGAGEVVAVATHEVVAVAAVLLAWKKVTRNTNEWN